MLLGGAAPECRRRIWCNVVSSRRDRIEAAKANWKSDRFKDVSGKLEFIPLPEG